ncbi:MAG: CehA/McbA family metallohydrolase [Thermoguttaceae bacterium]
MPIVNNVELQPLAAQVRRVIEATDYLGAPISAADKRALETAFNQGDANAATDALQRVLDRYCLFGVNINPESRVKVAAGPAKPELAEKGWRQFLVKVHNEAGVTAELRALSPNALSLYEGGSSSTPSDKAYRKPGTAPASSARELWLDLQMFNQQPLRQRLSGLGLEYRIIQLYSRDAGKREAKISFNVGQGTQDLGFRNDVDVLFTCAPASKVTFRVHDENNAPTTATFVIRDKQGRVHPSQAKRLAPDFAFHPQVYRADGETEKLPPGEYTVEFGRGPEYLTKTRSLKVEGRETVWQFELKRWIDPSKLGWWSGDHHIHAAGCAHYTVPSEGVHAPDMMRHCLGEDLKVGCNLTWGPCFDYQKQFFTGKDDKVSRPPYLLHYDVEVSGFGSHQSGHLCLLRLKEQIYPGGDSDAHWPTLCLNTLRWARKQGAVVGSAHSGWGLQVDSDELPNYIVPPFDGIGANEYIVDVTHDVPGPDGKPVRAVDFISTVDTPYVWELNIWYHTLNVGYRTRISGETDFPCIYGERVGLGRSYVKLDGKLSYEDWCEGIRNGRNYVSDGRSHLLEFKVNDLALGENGSELKLSQPGDVRVSVRAAALLSEKANPEIKSRRYADKPYWDVERARIAGTREVPIEIVVNGYPVARQNIVADGTVRDLTFDVKIGRSSWVAVRILPSSHTNPIFVLVGDKAVRASKRSAEWCLKGVDQCWSQKQRFIKPDEMEQAKQDYEHARQSYRQRLAECEAD